MLNIGVVGLGGISRRHIGELLKYDNAVIRAVCDIVPEKLKETGDQLNIPESHRFTDYRELVACPDVDAVEICTPNHLHVPIALEAVRAGKAIEVEKPLSTSYADGVDTLLAELKKTNLPNMMCFSYRFMPAVRYAKHLLESGKLGQIINVNVEYLQSGVFIPGRRLDWRFVKEYAGHGTLADLGAHLIDMTRFLIGDFESVYGMSNIIIKERRRLDSEALAPVGVDDLTGFMARLNGGVIANFLVTKCAIGESNTIKYEIYGTDGVIKFNLNHADTLTVCFAGENRTDGKSETIPVPEEFYLDQEFAFVQAASGQNTPYLPTVEDGAACQKVIDAVGRSAAENAVIML